MLKEVKPYVTMILLQFSFAVMYVILLATLKQGMNQSVLLVYRNIIAAMVMIPFSIWFERKERPKVTRIVFLKIITLAILQVLDQNFYFMGAKLTSASFASALENINPTITLIIALVLRVEMLNIRRRQGQAKVMGSLLAVAGAVLMILYKGPIVEFFWSKGRGHHSTTDGDAADTFRWIKGTLMVFVSCFSWSSFLILQSNTLKSYPAKITLTIYVCSTGAVINAAIALVMEHGSFEPWVLGWDMRLFVIIYSGVVCTAITYFVLGVVMKEKGPVFASAFNPLTMIMTTIMSSIFLAEKTALGTIIGSAILVAGLYSLLWGKSKDHPAPPMEGKVVEPELPIATLNPIEQESTQVHVIIDQEIKGNQGLIHFVNSQSIHESHEWPQMVYCLEGRFVCAKK